MSVRGWVYVITNKAMPGLVKVGYSTKDPMLRAKELDGTGVPHAFEVIYDALVSNPREVEQKAHKLLSESREAKEWFHCSIEAALQAIRSSAGQIYQETMHQYVEPKVNPQTNDASPQTNNASSIDEDPLLAATLKERAKRGAALLAKAEAERKLAKVKEFDKAEAEAADRRRSPVGKEEARIQKLKELEAEKIRQEKVRLWKDDELNRLQRIYEKGLRR
jgi:hypothetical protein